jgi:hypothetical protein
VEIQPLPESHTAQEATSVTWKEEAQQCTRDHRCLLQEHIANGPFTEEHENIADPVK